MSPLSKGEQYLVNEIRRGSAEAWGQLVDRYQGRLEAFARHKLRNSADAEDLVQDTFLSFVKGLDRYREQASIETYLFTILRRRIINHVRGRKVSVCLLQDTIPPSEDGETQAAADRLPGDDPTASWYARRQEAHDAQREALAAALDRLIGHYRETLNFRDLQIVEMLFFCQLRNKDIADIAEVTANHVALVKHRSLKQVQQFLAETPAIGGVWEPPDTLMVDIWQEYRLSCPKRTTIGAYHLGTLDDAWRDYVAFHLDRLGCTFCRSNLEDLQQQTADEGPRRLQQRILESTVGFLHKP